MSSTNVAINGGHSPGYTALAFSRNGAYCYTGGDDCIVRIWKTDAPDEEPAIAPDSGEAITVVATGNDTWYSGSKDSDVRQYRSGSGEFDALVTSVAGVSIRSIAVDPAGKRVAVSSDELEVKIIDAEEIEVLAMLHGHKDCVRRVSWDPSGSFLTTSGADGTIIVWDMTQQDPRQVKVLDGIIPAVKDKDSVEFAHDCSAVWHSSGQYFVVATRTHEIITISRETWTKSSTFSDDSSSGAITALALSVNGVYLASASNKSVHIWSTQNRRLLFKFPDPLSEMVTQLAFSPTKNLLAWTDYSGTLYRWSDPIPASSPSPVKSSITASATRPIRRQATPTLFDDDDTTGNNNDKGKAGGDVDMDGLNDFENEDWILDDIGGGLNDEPEEERAGVTGFVKEMVSVTKAQPAFQPGSTPMEHKKRYLAYNMIGVIEVTDQDTHHIVNVEFHDRSARKAYHFTDHFKYDLAALGERGALYACQPESEHPAHVTYKPYGNWATQGEWTYELDDGVKVLGVAAGGPPPTKSLRMLSDGDMQGNGNVVVATSDNELTFLTGTGIERCSVALDGDFVSMVAGPEWVFVVQRDGATTMDGSQNLTGTLYDFEDLCVLQNRKLPIRKGHTLQWLGISEEGAPTVYDSAGVMYLMPRFRIPLRGTWVRILDTNKLERKVGKDESYWPVGLSGDTFMCLILKGRQEHPSFPRPLIQELPVRLPFRRKDPKEGPLEEHIARESMNLLIGHDALGDDLATDDILKRELALDKELIQLIQNACKNDKLPRALELTRMLHHTASFDMAMKVAAFYHLVGLQEKMEALKDDREDSDRLAHGRDKRRRWARDYDAVPPPRLPPADVVSSRTKAFQDFGPPPSVYRPGLTRATPAPTAKPAHNEREYQMDDEYTTPPPEGKRKRIEEDLSYRDSTSPDGVKRRVLDAPPTETMPPPPPKQKSNPFAKKTAPDTARNPFARNAEHNKSLHKSESFFDKVDAVETGKLKRLSLYELIFALY
ncbi:WD40 repeat-like protein [Artomyces pyxidatus]|uniref:WD40 repeat-like protein n=1 Tax=Artomyces pyxidatus TaxID=48021 RepID=A0ACB8TD49_9AGAM|nr:WD40 repeat-like protein [Artomyces pyxidatus]